MATLASQRRRVGRPARISRQQIAEAANEVGLSGLTLRAVADRLGVSIASLYHHVDGKDDLLRLAAEHSVARTPMPRDEGQDWRAWLREWAVYNRSAFVADPALLGQYMEGAIAPEVIAASTDLILQVLVRAGFTVREAHEAYHLVSWCAVGAAVAAIRERGQAARGEPLFEVRDDLPHLRALVADSADRPLASFEERIEIVLDGIAARHEG
jgi:AcrR family transcriptional regulator